MMNIATYTFVRKQEQGGCKRDHIEVFKKAVRVAMEKKLLKDPV